MVLVGEDVMKFGRPIVLALSLVLGLSSCASIGDDTQAITAKVADKVAMVSEVYRPLRICLMAAGIVEVMTDRVQVFDSSQAPEALGRLLSLQAAVAEVRFADPVWLNTDMADVSLRLADVLHGAGHEKFARFLSGGPTLSNFHDVAQRATLLAVKGDAILLDINTMLEMVDNGIFSEDRAWTACNSRIEKNKRALEALSGV